MLLQLSAAELGLLIAAQGESGRTLLTERLQARYQATTGRPAKGGDVAAWNNSIPVVVEALLTNGLDGVEVQIEFALPHTNSAVDLVLCGLRPGSEEDSYLAVELKQIRHATVDPGCPIAVDLGFGDGKNKLHPVRQIQRYCDYMKRYIQHLRNSEDSLTGMALLHNARDEHVEALFALPESSHGWLYTVDDMDRFGLILRSKFTASSGMRAAKALAEGRLNPLLKVTDVARQRSVTGGGLTLLDEQYVAFSQITRKVERAAPPARVGLELFYDVGASHSPASDPGGKHVFILRGGPGSGKSAIALELQRELGLRGREAVLASGSHAYTETLREIMIGSARHGQLKDKGEAARKLYRYFNSFTDAPADSVEVLICDEAHRMRRNSTDRWTPKEIRDDDRPQAVELFRAARMPIFLLDDHQSIRPDEVGTAEYLKELAQAHGYEVSVADLEGSFRAGGSKQYQGWVQRLLGLGTPSDPVAWHPDGRMTLTVADSPEQMEQFIRERGDAGATARITAGFCWRWSDPNGSELVDDVRVGEWQRPWNVKPHHEVPNAPKSDLWSTDPRGIGQVGCVYTAQTFEYDWNGVIIGPDLLFRNGEFRVDRTASRDPGLRRAVDDEIVERCIRNAYHVLLTRGVAGTVLYAVDHDTHNALRELIPGTIGLQEMGGGRQQLTAEGAQLPPAYRKQRG